MQVLYKHEGHAALKVLDKGKSSISLPLPKDNGYLVLEVRSWGEGGDGPAHEIIVSRDSGQSGSLCVHLVGKRNRRFIRSSATRTGTGMMVQNSSSTSSLCVLLAALTVLRLVSNL